MKFQMKIAVLFALLFASMSWCYVNEVYLSFGTSSDAKSILSDRLKAECFVTGDISINASSISAANAQDFVANTGCGKSCYTFMGYDTTGYAKKFSGDTYSLPITKIVVKEYSSPNPSEYIYIDGIRYQRLIQYKLNKENLVSLGKNDICNNNCSSENYVYIYYTREDVDGQVVYDIKASTESTLSKHTRIDVDLTGGKGDKPIYLFVNRGYPLTGAYFYPDFPYGRTASSDWSSDYLEYTGTARTLLSSPGVPHGDAIDHVEYSVNGGSWSSSEPKATNAGTYNIWAKIVSNDRRYADYVYGDIYGANNNKVSTVINKASSLKVVQYENSKWQNFYLYTATFKNKLGATYNAVTGTGSTNFYSKDNISLNWSDKCGTAATPRFFYKKGASARYYEFASTGNNLTSGTYAIYASLSETDNCEAIEYDSIATITIKKSKMTFYANGGNINGASQVTREGETGESYTKPADPTRTGYSFAGWDPALPSTIECGAKTYSALWNVSTYTLKFDADGGLFSDGALVKTYKKDYATSITRPTAPTRTDYVFDGWLQTYPVTTTPVTTIPTAMPATNLTFTAQWKYNRFKVNLPEQMEVVSGDVADDGTYLKGSTVKFRVKAEYLVRNDLTYNGKSVVPDKNGIYSITVVGKDADVVAEIVKDYGAIQIAADGSKAYIDGDKVSVATDVPEETEVSSVEMNRTFTPFIATTIALPFTVDLEYVWGGVFCKFLGMAKSGFQYTARLMFVSTSIKANEPYVFVPFDEHISIDLPKGETVKIKTEEKSTVFGDWSFNSLYHEKVWKDGVSEDDVKGDVGYGFSASTASSDGVSGSFVKMTNGSIGAMQGYILYRVNKPQSINRSPSMAGKSAPSFSVEDLPDEIGIEIVTENGKTVALGKVNTVTGKVKLDCWFDMKGNLLKGKPTTKGVYIYNGKQVTIK